MTEQPKTSGVQELIDKLKTDGVDRGRSEADVLVTEARQEAMKVLDAAKTEADEILAQARAEAERFQKMGEDGLRLASRDAILTLSESIRSALSSTVNRLVAHTMNDPQYLKSLILAIARQAVPDESGDLEVRFPATIPTVEELRDNPESQESGSLTHLALGLTADALREGLTVVPGDDVNSGLSVRIVDKDAEIDLTDKGVSALLMQHLIPRLRAVIGD